MLYNLIESYLFKPIKSLFFPHICLICEKSLLYEYNLCYECWKETKLITNFSCRLCAIPFYSETIGRTPSLICEECQIKSFHYDIFKTVFAYKSSLKKLILDFKHQDDLYLIKPFSFWIYRACQNILDDVDLITGVPLHPKRLLKRRYNQSFVLAERLSQISKTPINLYLLKRLSFEKSQKNLSAEERWHNVKNAFSFNKKMTSSIQGKNILLIDDVCTTGSTLNACSLILKLNGAKKVFAVTLARSFKEEFSYKF
jgi:ComF family protein